MDIQILKLFKLELQEEYKENQGQILRNKFESNPQNLHVAAAAVNVRTSVAV